MVENLKYYIIVLYKNSGESCGSILALVQMRYLLN